MADLTGMMQAAAGAAGGGDNLFIEDVFSTFLYTGNGSTQTITNGIDLDSEGGLVWLKRRDSTQDHGLFDTDRGATKFLQSNGADAEITNATSLTSFNSDGFTLGSFFVFNNDPTRTYCSWTFRKAPKFFDIVTYTGNGSNPRTISHNLGSVPGCIIVKATNAAGENWTVYHRGLNGGTTPQNFGIYLNSTNAAIDEAGFWSDTAPTSTGFTVGGNLNSSFGGGMTFVAYLFAHDDGGFGDDGTENVITCGSFTTDGSANATVSLGYEPQWVMAKRTSNTGGWCIQDNMRGFTAKPTTYTANPILFANSSDAEITGGADTLQMTATGFTTDNVSYNANSTFIFIAIRRGPMKTPTAGTEVFSPNAVAGYPSTITTGFPVDLALFSRTSGGDGIAIDRLRGSSTTSSKQLATLSNAAETSSASFGLGLDSNVGYINNYSDPDIWWNFRRAPGYFDVVCWTGTGSYPFTINHNLGVVPELMIFKKRNAVDSWYAYAEPVVSPVANWYQNYGSLNNNLAFSGDTGSFTSSPTSTTIPTASYYADSAVTYIAYLFASLAGVQDIGSYTGNGTSLTVTTGFQPRFIMVKRTDSTGNWIVGDSARGLIAGNDPALFLNSNAAQVTNQDWVDISATGFTVNETGVNANVSTATYLYLAIS